MRLMTRCCLVPMVFALLLSASFAQRVLTSPSAGGNSQNGIMFDVSASSEILVTGFDFFAALSSPSDVEVWIRTGGGSHVGVETNPAAWTRIARYEGVVSAGAGLPTALPRDLRVTILSGATQGFYLTTTSTGLLSYGNGTAVGAVSVSDGFATLREGTGKEYPFGASFTPRVFRGNVVYRPVRRVPGFATSVQTAINLAANDDCIRVAGGTFGAPINFNGKRLLIWAPGGPNATTLDANLSGSVVQFVSGETAAAELDGFRLIRGSGAVGRGGGIHIDSSGPVLRNLVIDACVGGNDLNPANLPGAGGIQIVGASDVVVWDTVIRNCRGGVGSGGTELGGAGGLAVSGQFRANRLVVQNCEGGARSGGTGGPGGVSVGTLATANFSELRLLVNTAGNGNAGGVGGLISRNDAAPRIDRAVIIDNRGGQGTVSEGGTGGVRFQSSGSRITASVLHANLGGTSSFGRQGTGGLAFVGDTGARALNCTIVGNSGAAGVGPGGIGFIELLISSPTVANCIVHANNGPEIATFSAVGPNATVATVSSSLIEGGFAGAGNFSGDPVFFNPAGDDFRLQAPSPAFNSGVSGFVDEPTLDLAGNAYGAFGARDVGAFEIPEFMLAGSREDLVLESFVQGVRSFRPGIGQTVDLRLSSPGSTFAFGVPVLSAQAFTSAAMPGNLASVGLPEILFDLNAFTILFNGTTFPAPFGPAVLGSGGLSFSVPVSMSFGGVQVRFQSIALSGAARNGSFATSNALDIALP